MKLSIFLEYVCPETGTTCSNPNFSAISRSSLKTFSSSSKS
ncbi:MAG: hypothetical protein SOT09_05060 [Candidatus Borkfalkiaceae bacterium]|nr:hypothetical protein [Christensenellaceae bacterium]